MERSKEIPRTASKTEARMIKYYLYAASVSIGFASFKGGCTTVVAVGQSDNDNSRTGIDVPVGFYALQLTKSVLFSSPQSVQHSKYSMYVSIMSNIPRWGQRSQSPEAWFSRPHTVRERECLRSRLAYQLNLTLCGIKHFQRSCEPQYGV